jgi:radical SAM superfamily enzyme YgiQ (UPF0313 family)
MKKQVLLVAPYIHDFAAFDLWLKPLGLLYVAASAERAGYEVRVVNCIERLQPAASSEENEGRWKTSGDGRGKLRYEVIDKPECLRRVPRQYRRYGIPHEAFLKRLSEGPRPDAIGVGSMMTYWCGGVSETIDIVRSFYPGVPVILGGVYATICVDHARAYSRADIVVEGPAETKFVDVLDECIGSAGGGQNQPIPLWPAYHLLENLDSVSMLTSFGCPFSCSYCASKMLRKRFVQRPIREVVAEIVQYGREMMIRDIAFYDDALLVNVNEHIKPILRAIIDRKLNLRFHTPNGLHANMIDEELAVLMKQAGFATVRLSVESVHENRLRDSCMKVSPAGFEKAISHLLSAGYASGEIEAYVLMGAPGQQLEEIEQTIIFVHETGAIVRLADFSPIPGTGYFESAEKIYGFDFGEPLLQNSSVIPHIIPGLYEKYQKMKALAKSLNNEIFAGGPQH